MNTLGLNILVRMGCLCTREKITINGKRYTVLHRIAEGGFSVIDLMENATTGRRFALKRITCHCKDDETTALKEIEIGKQVRHRNVIEMIDFELDGMADMVLNTTSQVHIVLPYYRRGSLHDELVVRASSHDYMNERQLIKIFLGICEGVKAFHEAQPEPLAHRDLKTANVCLSDSMEPIIIDIGSATEARVQVCGQSDAQRLQDLAEERCSIAYRPPELFCVQSYCTIDERTDIWSLGCLLYAMCFFKSPFDAAYERGDSVALAVMSGNVAYPPDSPYTKDMPELINYMLRLNPMERPYIYSVIEKANDLLIKLENRI